jgi:hypothetical protein
LKGEFAKGKSRSTQSWITVIAYTMLGLRSLQIVHAQTKKPNILVIMGDDIGWYNASIFNRGDMGYETPNIDRIGKEGAFSPGTVSKAAPPDAPPSSPASLPFAPASPRWACPALKRVSSARI